MNYRNGKWHELGKKNKKKKLQLVQQQQLLLVVVLTKMEARSSASSPEWSIHPVRSGVCAIDQVLRTSLAQIRGDIAEAGQAFLLCDVDHARWVEGDFAEASR